MSHQFFDRRWSPPDEYFIYRERSLEYPVSDDCEEVRSCVFQVPITIYNLKPEAYAPQKIGLGPFHHFNPDVHKKMELKKLNAISKFLVKNDDLLKLLRQRLLQSEVMVRGLYESNFDMTGAKLMSVLADDILFLLNFLLAYTPHHLLNPSTLRESVKDIMMLENQIPFDLLRPIEKFCGLSSRGDVNITELQHLFFRQIQSFTDDYSDDLLYLSVFGLCDKHSPLELATETQRFRLYSTSDHLLDFMYKLIVGRYSQGTDGGSTPASENVPGVSVLDLLHQQHSLLELAAVAVNKLSLLMEKFLSRADLQPILNFLKFLMFLKNLPWKSILVLWQCLFFYKRNNNKRDPVVRKIKIPSTSKLCKIGGVGFKAATLEDEPIHFCREQVILRLTPLRLETDSEVILRNLVAYEASLSLSGNPLADHLDLMCGIMQTEEDVRVLRDRNIIRGSMNDGAILEIFEGIGKTTGHKLTTNNSLWKTIVGINNHFDSRPWVKVERLMSKFGNFLYDLWKLLIFFLSALSILHLCFKEYSKVYGYPTFLGKYGMDILHL